ncbi:MAG: shikimate dehydrogenase [Blastocatellia bacterium AA13]|nr:MAG: shikimate dehydrogenase [Blastocatellia bacterium AA13]
MNSIAQPTVRVCAAITESTVEGARAAMQRAAACADMIELRLDYLRDLDFTRVESLRPLIEDPPLPTIITCRALDEGGRQAIEDKIRLRLLIDGAKRYSVFCDVEAAHYHTAASMEPDQSRLIVSYHNFAETPPDLEAVWEIVAALPAAIHKIVTMASDSSDSLAMFRLLDRAHHTNRPVIAMVMGEAGVATRILGPSRGSYLTYGSLARGRESAPGQLTCEELREVYRINRVSRNTIITGIIGSPVMHSVSPAIHNAAFNELGMDYVYLPLQVRDLGEFIAKFVSPSSREMHWNAGGFSVTLPHKSAIIPYLDVIDPAALAIGAVNTIVVKEGRLEGHNTDAEGFIAPLLKVASLLGKRCAVLGAGGAARSVVHALKARGAIVTLFVRDEKKASDVFAASEVNIEPIGSFPDSHSEIVINSTPIGMRGHSEGESPAPLGSMHGCEIAYDLVYNPLSTKFLEDAASQGCYTISGLDMLIGQAVLQFELWTGRNAPIEVMRAAALASLNP